MSTGALKAVIASAFLGTETYVRHTTTTIRARLLPGLQELQQRLPHGEWQKFLRSVGLNPHTVRQWRRRERTATLEVERLLGGGEEELPPRRKQTMPESAAQQLAKAGKRLATAVLNKPPYAKKLAKHYLDAYSDYET